MGEIGAAVAVCGLCGGARGSNLAARAGREAHLDLPITPDMTDGSAEEKEVRDRRGVRKT